MENYTKEITKFKHGAVGTDISPAKWMKLREACLEKFGEEDGPKKFKAWQKGKFIRIQY